MRQATIIDDGKKEDWDRFVLNHPDAISWHVYDWSKVLHDYHGLTYLPIAVYRGSEICGILPLYRVRTLRSGPALVSIPYVVAGGIVAEDEDAQRLLLDKAVRLSREMGSVPITLKQYRRRVAGSLQTDSGFYNLELNLLDGTEPIWTNLPERNKEMIERAAPDGLELDYPSRDLAAFCRALSRHQHRSGTPCHSRRWIRLLLATGMYDVALLRNNGRITAATLVKQFNQTVSFPLTCLPTGADADLPFAYRLYWELLQRLASEGIRIFHSGRIPNDRSVPEYRLGWGGDRYEYFYQYYGLRGKTETASKRGRARSLVGNCWKRLPRHAANLLAPAIIKQFP